MHFGWPRSWGESTAGNDATIVHFPLASTSSAAGALKSSLPVPINYSQKQFWTRARAVFARARRTGSDAVSANGNGPQDLLAQEVRDVQHSMILAHTTVGTAVATIFAALLAYGVGNGALGVYGAAHLAAGWLAVKLAVSIPRALHARRCIRSTPDQARRLAGWTVPLLLVDGLVWGAGGAWLTTGSAQTATVSAAILCCIACVATFGLQVRAAAAAAYIGPMLMPVAIGLLLRGDGVGMVGGAGLILFLGLLLSTASRWQDFVARFTQLRLQSERISEERAAALELASLHSAAKDKFLAVVSHELRTPLHAIIGMTSLLRRETPRNQELQHYRFELVEEAAGHLRRMVSDLLDMSAVRSGKLELELQRVDFRRELNLLRETYSNRADESGMGFSMTVAEGVGRWVVCDEVRVAQVLHNLIGNAFKFCPMGGRIRLNVDRPDGGDLVSFTVADSGPGLSAEDIGRVFEAFVQGSGPAGARPQGVGLGLSIARELARAMGGDVVCTSQPGQGAEFVFTARMPAAAAEMPLDLARQQAADALVAGRPLGLGQTIVVADDDEPSLLVAVSAARTMGFQVDECRDGTTALRRLAVLSSRPAAAILDWDMPGMDGRAVTVALRRFEAEHRLEPIPVIGVSANGAVQDALAAVSNGMTVFLSKPSPPEEIAHAIAACLDLRVKDEERQRAPAPVLPKPAEPVGVERRRH